MHASVSSHGYGTKLLTQFIRLPIIGSQQLNMLNQRFTDFERQGMQMFRVPFVGAQGNQWRQRAELEGAATSTPDRNWLGKGEKALAYDDEAELLQAVEMRTQRHVQ